MKIFGTKFGKNTFITVFFQASQTCQDIWKRRFVHLKLSLIK
jgi:hypothetical protein